jgi:hypothetical protein
MPATITKKVKTKTNYYQNTLLNCKAYDGASDMDKYSVVDITELKKNVT